MRAKKTCRHTIAVLRHGARKFALSTRLIEGHQEYVRFVILCRNRTGSNMLKSALDSHPGMVVYGELFRRPGIVGWDRWPHVGPLFARSPRLAMVAKRDPIGFLQKHVFRRYEPAVRAVGFKIFYDHAHQPGWEPTWSWLEAQKDLSILHLKRRNMLHTYLSLVRARRSWRWIARPGDDGENGPIVLDFNECRAFFRRTRRWETEYGERFSDHPVMEVCYEDLVRDFPGEIARVQRFLGVPDEPVRPRTRKQAAIPLTEAIANYGELQERFADTPWACFFDDARLDPAVAPRGPRPE